MSRKEYLTKERNSVISVFHQFRLKYKRGSEDIYVFFEGNDDCSYYMPEIRRHWADRGGVIVFVCGGKDTVINVYPKVRRKIDNISRALFFIDKDVDDIIGHKLPRSRNIFVTSYYSIENYLVTEDVFGIIWTDIFHLDRSDPRYLGFLSTYRYCSEAFNSIMMPIMAWIVFEKKRETNIRLNNINLKKSISFSKDFRIVRKKKCFEGILRSAGDKSCTSIYELREIWRIIRQMEYKRYMRGKFEIWFMVTFVNRVADIVRKRMSGYKRAVIRQQITYENVVEVLAGKVPYPDALYTFLEYNLARL